MFTLALIVFLQNVAGGFPARARPRPPAGSTPGTARPPGSGGSVWRRGRAEHLALLQQLHHRDGRQQGRVLEHGDQIVAQCRHHRRNRLRQHVHRRAQRGGFRAMAASVCPWARLRCRRGTPRRNRRRSAGPAPAPGGQRRRAQAGQRQDIEQEVSAPAAACCARTRSRRPPAMTPAAAGSVAAAPAPGRVTATSMPSTVAWIVMTRAAPSVGRISSAYDQSNIGVIGCASSVQAGARRGDQQGHGEVHQQHQAEDLGGAQGLAAQHWPRKVRSVMVTSDTSAVFLSSSINRLPAGGSIAGTACGKTSRRRICPRVKFSATPASRWPDGTARIAPRTTSAP